MKHYTVRVVILFMSIILYSQQQSVRAENFPPQQIQQTATPQTQQPAQTTQQTTPEPTKRDDIVRLLKMQNGEILKQSMSHVKMAIPKLPDNIVKQVFNEQMIMEILIPSYDKHYTHEEIKGLIQFYETPLGQKFLVTVPKISEDATNTVTKKVTGTTNDALKKIKKLWK